ncbi:MAG: hypothetical protein ACXVJN_23485 [Mucilaginibacter sp.]
MPASQVGQHAGTVGQHRRNLQNANHLQEIKNKVQQKDKETLQLLGSLKKQADELMDKRSKLRIDN